MRLSPKRIISPVFAALFLAGPLLAERTQMEDAICNGELETVKRLVRNGYNVNRPMGDSNGVYPLSLAAYCYGGKASIADYLLDKGANPNAHRSGEYSPLMWALRSVDEIGDPMHAVVLKMIQRGARVIYQDDTTGRTPLMLAARLGDEKLVNLMLRKGASNAPRTKGDWCISGLDRKCSAADHARLGGYVELALKLEGKPTTSYKNTLHYAVIKGDVQAVRQWVRSGKNLNEVEAVSNYTPLHYAVMHDRIEIARILGSAHAEMDPRSYAGTTPLREAVVYYKTDMAKLLIDLGAAATNYQTQGCGAGLSEFGWAIEYSQHDLASYMIEKGAISPTQPGKAFQEMYGRNEKELDIARALIDTGARPDTNDIDRLELIAKNNNWIREAGTNAKLVALYREAMQNPVKPDTGDEVVVDIEIPDIPMELLQARTRSTPLPAIRHRSIEKNLEEARKRDAFRQSLPQKARDFDTIFRDPEGNLSSSPLR